MTDTTTTPQAEEFTCDNCDKPRDVSINYCSEDCKMELKVKEANLKPSEWPSGAFEAYLDATGADDLSDFEESYQGQYKNDEEFAQEQAEELYSAELKDSTWPFTCIDWERAAHDLMMDYTEQDGFYFRNL